MALRHNEPDPQLIADTARYNELTERVHIWAGKHKDPGIRTVDEYSSQETIFGHAVQQGIITRADYDFAREFAGRFWEL